jgi:threonine dehydrogenase-like Zn-dependent dehydrogenase
LTLAAACSRATDPPPLTPFGSARSGSWLIRKNLTLSAGITRRRREMLVRASAYLLDHPSLARDLISHELPVTEVQRAFELVAHAQDRCKIVLTVRDQHSERRL